MKPEWIAEGNAVYGIDQDCVLDKKRKKARQESIKAEKKELQRLRDKVSEASRKWEWDKKKLHQAGIRGRGVCVAVFDTGIFHHPDLNGRITGFWDYRKGECACCDENGHGTQVTELIRERKGEIFLWRAPSFYRKADVGKENRIST